MRGSSATTPECAASPIQDRYFSDYAETLLRQGYSPLPVDGKRPVIREWERLCQSLPSDWLLRKWVSQFPAHNVGAACGHLVALDIDDETEDGALALQSRAFGAFGETPLIRIGQAPRRVLLYRAPEPFPSIREKEVQVLGRGTQVVLFGLHPKTERPYTWPRATPLDISLKDLPLISEGGARDWLGRQSRQPHPAKRRHRETAAAIVAPFDCHDRVHEGIRNPFIFTEALTLATTVGSVDDLLFRLLGINDAPCWPPLPADEVRRTAQSVWRYRQSGHLFQRGGEAHAFIAASEFWALADEPNAMVLLILLRLSHGAREEPFAIATEAMSNARRIATWSRKMYAHAPDVLLERGFLELPHIGGGRGNPHLFKLRKPSPTGTQYNKDMLFFCCDCDSEE